VDLYPAIDLRGGCCVRLVEGDFSQETVYSGDPVATAYGFARAGARWIHVVDLDAARTGEPRNRPVVADIVRAVAPLGARVQSGGGVRNVDSAAFLIEAGVARVVIGTAAVENPSLVALIASHWPGQVAVGLDHRDGIVQLRGWTEGTTRTVTELVPAAVQSGASAVIVTDISRDGHMLGPDVYGLRDLASTGAPIIASGGVGSMEDLWALAAVPGLVGAIAGKAVYEGRIDVARAVAELA
jgi:phosphoribosylformimino-5-aminoimidazole carboxamide ribotide isomerase